MSPAEVPKGLRITHARRFEEYSNSLPHENSLEGKQILIRRIFLKASIKFSTASFIKFLVADVTCIGPAVVKSTKFIRHQVVLHVRRKRRGVFDDLKGESIV